MNSCVSPSLGCWEVTTRDLRTDTRCKTVTARRMTRDRQVETWRRTPGDVTMSLLATTTTRPDVAHISVDAVIDPRREVVRQLNTRALNYLGLTEDVVRSNYSGHSSTTPDAATFVDPSWVVVACAVSLIDECRRHCF